MPFALVFIGVTLVVTGVQNTYGELAAQLKSDFTGSHSFLVWILAIGGVGALGYIPALKTFSTLFMTLIIVAMLLANQGFFQRFSQQIGNIQPATGNNPAPVTAPAASSGGNVPLSNMTLWDKFLGANWRTLWGLAQ